MADVVYLLNRGSVGFSGPPDALDEDELMRGYLGAELHPTTDASQAGAPGSGGAQGAGAADPTPTQRSGDGASS
jgi:hypothetical protein